MERLQFIEKELIELMKMAREDRHDLLVYLLEMAIAEANQQAKNRRSKP